MKPSNLEGFVLQEEDIKELWADATQEDLEAVAEVLTDYLMDQWYDCLVEAVNTVRSDK